MDRKLRISAGAIIIQDERILLVKHGAARHGRDFLVGPGGGVENEESIVQAVTREVKEETGLDVSPDKILFIEDLVSPQQRVVKVWFQCHQIGGRLEKTNNAIEEGIVDARWYREEELVNEDVYPSELMNTDWRDFFKENYRTMYLESKVTDSDL
ncbi:NUDIX domain-containing protein [Chloroflexota bacterium]